MRITTTRKGHAHEALEQLHTFINDAPVYDPSDLEPKVFIVAKGNAFYADTDANHTLLAAPQEIGGTFDWDNPTEVDVSSIEDREDAKWIEDVCKFLRASWPTGFNGADRY